MKYFLILLIFTLLISCQSFEKNKNEIPSFDLLLDSATHFNTSQIPNGFTIAMLYFSPDCEHCFKETKDLLLHIQSFKNVRFYFITYDPLDRIQAFKNYFQISRYVNITIGRDYSYFFPTYFRSVIVPYLVIYDKCKKRRAIYSGEVEANTLINCINKL